ncbi:MAG: phosphatase PAP2 family protein [Ilumatobacteraceae bacterium]
MTLTVVVLVVAVAAALVAFAASAVRVLPDPIDPAAEERAAVRSLRRHPRLARFLRQRFDRRAAGGLLVTVSLLALFGVAFVIGVLLDMIDGSSGLARWDDELAGWGVGRADSLSVEVLSIVTHLGGTWVVTAGLVAAVLVDLMRNRNLEVVAFAAVVLVGEKLIVNGLKALIDRERPDVIALVSFAGQSFPSGHAAAAAAVWPAVALILGRDRPRVVRAALGGAAALIAFAVAASRALLGVHWLTDVIGGLAVGYGWFVVVAVIFGGRAQRLGDPVTAHPQGVQSVEDYGRGRVGAERQ